VALSRGPERRAYITWTRRDEQLITVERGYSCYDGSGGRNWRSVFVSTNVRSRWPSSRPSHGAREMAARAAAGSGFGRTRRICRPHQEALIEGGSRPANQIARKCLVKQRSRTTLTNTLHVALPGMPSFFKITPAIRPTG